MSPRKYDMGGRRAQAVEATRRRILEATMELHGDRGVVATSWEDIAARAGVAVGTVYRHFPSLDELLPACGEVSFERLRPPAPQDAEALLDGAADPVERMVDVLFAAYGRAPDVMTSIRRDRDRVPVLQEAHERIEAGIDALVSAALPGASPQEHRVARALTDFDAWRAMRAHGVEPERARAVVAAALRPTR